MEASTAAAPINSRRGERAGGLRGILNIRRVASWLRSRHPEAEHYSLVAVALCCAGLVVPMLLTGWGLYVQSTGDSALYLLSSLIQSLSAVLALLVTLSLLATQLASSSFTPRLVTRRLTDPWMWGAIFTYLLAIGWSMIVLSGLGTASDRLHSKYIDIAVILAIFSFAYLVPFVIATVKSMQPAGIAKWLAERGDNESLLEMMRKTADEGAISTLGHTLDRVGAACVKRLRKASGDASEATKMTKVLVSLGRHCCHRRDPDSLQLVMVHLADMVLVCNDSPPYWREAADVFNEAVRELYLYSEEWLGRSAL